MIASDVLVVDECHSAPTSELAHDLSRSSQFGRAAVLSVALILTTGACAKDNYEHAKETRNISTIELPPVAIEELTIRAISQFASITDTLRKNSGFPQKYLDATTGTSQDEKVASLVNLARESIDFRNAVFRDQHASLFPYATKDAILTLGLEQFMSNSAAPFTVVGNARIESLQLSPSAPNSVFACERFGVVIAHSDNLTSLGKIDLATKVNKAAPSVVRYDLTNRGAGAKVEHVVFYAGSTSEAAKVEAESAPICVRKANTWTIKFPTTRIETVKVI